MQLHTLRPTITHRERKRIGRGGKRGTYSGRGQKGQHARSGRKIRPTAERELIARMPKLRGIKNKRKSDPALVINVQYLSRFAEGGAVNRAILLKNGFISNVKSPVKILGSGAVKGAFVVQKIPVSKSAKEKIEAAGGKIE